MKKLEDTVHAALKTTEEEGSPSKRLDFCTVSTHILINFVKIAERKPIFGLCSYCYSQ